MLSADARAVIEPAAVARHGGRPRRGQWRVRFRPRWAPAPDPLTGWIGGGDPLATIDLSFPNRSAAERYCQKAAFTSAPTAPATRAARPSLAYRAAAPFGFAGALTEPAAARQASRHARERRVRSLRDCRTIG